MIAVFSDTEDFAALRRAEAWCRERGISYGSSCANSPTGLLWGDYTIAKWKNLTGRERRMLHGKMTGDFRKGPVTVTIAEREQCIRVPGRIA